MTADIIASVVILTKDGGELLEKSIKMIFQQKTSFRFEVIAVDSGSKDSSLKFMKKYPIKIFKIEPHHFSFGQIRDFGFMQTKGEYLITISQDAVPVDNNWMNNLILPLISNDADVVQGYDTPPPDRKVFFWVRKGMFHFTSDGKNFIEKNGKIGLSCSNISMKRKVWEEVRFGEIPMSEDKLFQKKAFSKGYRFISKKNAMMFHAHNYSLSSLIKRCENEGMGWRYVGIKYTLRQMLKDLFQEKWVYGELINGILNKEISSISEVLFLLIKPIFLFKGNLFNKRYKF